MARQGTAPTGIFATREELEAELDRLGAAGEFDSAIARATGISSAAVAKYLRSHPASKRRPTPPRPPEPVVPAALEMESTPEAEATSDVLLVFPLVAEGRRILNSQGELVAEAVDGAMASNIASAINSASALAEALFASSPVAPATPAAEDPSPPRRRGGRPRKAAPTEPLPASTAGTDGGSAPAKKGGRKSPRP